MGMNPSNMSFASIRLQNVSVLGMLQGPAMSILLSRPDHAFFVIPISDTTTFRSKSSGRLEVKPGQMLVAAGGATISLDCNSNSCNGEYSPPNLIPTIDVQNLSAKTQDRDEVTILLLTVELCDPFKQGLRKVLPSFLHLQNLDKSTKRTLKNTARQILLANNRQDEIGKASCDRLAELLFIQTIDSYFSGDAETDGLLKAMSDRRLRNAVIAIHNQPGNIWTVETLASIATMSRSLFAEKFKRALNETPLGYVRLCRIHKAKLLLNESSASIDHVAQESGYASQSSFVKAFSAVTGETPGQWRDNHSHEKITHTVM